MSDKDYKLVGYILESDYNAITQSPYCESAYISVVPLGKSFPVYVKLSSDEIITPQ